ncbi:MAG: hypothetical protein K0S12_1396 [Bacteroidetes bacterium]|nr:hypothetical protein [Bacteroidota bacterium]
MNTSAQIAKHFREVYFGGNWTCSNVKDNLANITWQQATTKVQSFNTIATLVYHMGYYTTAVLKVFNGGPLDAKDEYSFNTPMIRSDKDWNDLVSKVLSEAETLASLIEQLPDDKLADDFTDKKYGSYYRNLHGMIEHTHYHLGQIALLKKMV